MTTSIRDISKHPLLHLFRFFRKKKCPYCLNSFRLFEIDTYKKNVACPRCGSPLPFEVFNLPLLVLSLFSKNQSVSFQKKCLSTDFSTAFLQKKGCFLTPLSEKNGLFLVSKKTRSSIKSLCILRFLLLEEEDFEDSFPLPKLTDGLVVFLDYPKEDLTSLQVSLPISLKVLLHYITNPRTKKMINKSFPLGIVFSSLNTLSDYLPATLSVYINPPPEFNESLGLFSGYLRSLLGVWYGMTPLQTIEKSFSRVWYGALMLEQENTDTAFPLSYESDLLSFFLTSWGFKVKKHFNKLFSPNKIYSNFILPLLSYKVEKIEKREMKQEPSFKKDSF